MKLYSLNGKTALVTGALGLLGKKHCEALAMAGANIVVADLDLDKTQEFAASLGKNHMGLRLDVTNKELLEQNAKEILSRYGTIDVLVNNAAVNDSLEKSTLGINLSAFENYPLEAFRQSLEVNIIGVFLCSQVFGSIMASRQSGSIINIASTYGMVGPDQSIYRDETGAQKFYKSAAYPVTKGAVINFTRFLAAYWGSKQVRVNSLSPGGVENHQDDYFIDNYSSRTPLGRMAKPTDYQGALIFLASEASEYMTGSNLVVDGGWTCI